ncbi:MAG: restriction endonuclease, partial [Tissierellia bacterium]|nr:restriction endonuclease [Tissierellia bacterium]
MLITTDNNCGKEIDCRFIPDFQRIANKTIGSLTIEDNPNLLIFPNDFTHYGDKIGEAPVFA